jgi:hypothetical protein
MNNQWADKMLHDRVPYAMKRYYEALEVSPTATPEQIKAQYKQLVRVYHPDRFADPAAKTQAEERFKIINEAYAALTKALEQQSVRLTGPRPKPVATTEVLDFGMLRRGDKRVQTFQVDNAADPASNVTYRFSSNFPWFKIAEISPVENDKPLPLLFKVETTLQEVEEVGDYTGLIEINMDGQMAFVRLAMQLQLPPPARRWPKFKLVYALAAVLILLAVASIPFLSKLTALTYSAPASTAVTAIPTKRAASSTPVAKVDASVTSVQKANATNSSQWSPIYSPDGSQIAFLSKELGDIQVYIRDPRSGRLRQLTTTPEEKSVLVWSPDSQSLAYVASEREESTIHIVDLQSNNVHKLAPVSLPGTIKHLIWATDGKSVIFDYYQGNEQRFYQGNLQNNQVDPFNPPPGWDSSWARD